MKKCARRYKAYAHFEDTSADEQESFFCTLCWHLVEENHFKKTGVYVNQIAGVTK